MGLSSPLMTVKALGVVTDLFTRLHAGGIVYCHWKSNEHLDASMSGATDFDLLIDRNDAQAVTAIFSELHIKRFEVAPFHRYPGVEDYLCVDPETAKLIHLHVHYQLTVGEKLLNGHRLPWEEIVLSTRELDARHEIYVADPHVELVLLVARAALKLRMRDLLLGTFRRSWFQQKVLREFAWLARRVERERLLDVAGRLVGARAARILLDMVDVPPRKRRLLAFRRACEPSLTSYRSYSPWGARIRRWLREGRTLWWWMENRYHGVPKNSSRTCPQGGSVIAFVGDRPGRRSAIARAVAEWLAEEVAVVPIRPAPRLPARARRARSLGNVVIVDGWPAAESSAPDVVVNLDSSPSPYPPTTRVVDIDANLPIERVLPEVKHAIWQYI